MIKKRSHHLAGKSDIYLEKALIFIDHQLLLSGRY